jgi:hypothetical protein
MIELASADKVLASISAAQVGSFLRRRGFQLVGEKPEVIRVFENGKREVIAVPLDQSATSYARRIRDILEVFVDAWTPLDDVVGAVVLPCFDVFRYRIHTPEATWGHVRLWYASEVMPAMFDILKYTAAGVYSHKPDYTSVGALPKLFVYQCRFGQTEYGSFVLKIYCPTNPVGAAKDMVSSEPFGRTTTQALIDNFAFLASERSQDPSEPLPPAMNRNVATAVTRLNPQTTIGLATEVLLRYMDLDGQSEQMARPVAKPDEVLDRVDLGQFVYSHAASVRDRLKKAEEFAREIMRGYITDLHKDRPTEKGEQSHEITLAVRHGFRSRQVRLRLLPVDYRRAVRWHDENTEVDLDAKIDKRRHVWTVEELYALRPTKPVPDQPMLFPEVTGDDEDPAMP